MKPELDRVKNDLETMQKAIGLTPSLGREWPRWLKRDRWLSFWWCLPGLMLIAGALAPLDQTKKILGLMTGQWIGLAVAGVLLGILFFWEKMLRGSVRPAEVTREYKRINAQALWFLVGFVAQIAFYFAWGAQHAIDGKPFMAGLWIVCGSSMLLLATVTKVWVYLGWALPMLAYGLCHPLLEQQGLWLGVVFIIAAFLSWAIQGAQSRIIAVQHVAD